MHITEAMHRWQFVKKSSTVQTPIFSRNPNHKNTAGTKKKKSNFKLFMVASDDTTIQTNAFLQKECTAAEMQQSTFRKVCTAKGRTSVHRLNSGNGGVVQKAAGKPSLKAAKHILTALQRLPKCTVFSHQSKKEILHEQAAEKIWLSCLYCTYSKIPN